jgi:hypothetical protein
MFAQLPDDFTDFAARQTAGESKPSDAFLTFCHREFLHAQWKIMLDDEFIHAWVHGIPITCCDGVMRRFYPRIFTHSGDYPEKCVCLHHVSSVFSCILTGFFLRAFETWAGARAPVVASL